jgi:hypothetical protein
VQAEELAQGRPEDDSPTGLGPPAWSLIAVLCLLAGVAFLAFRDTAEPAPTTGRPTPTEAQPSRRSDLASITSPQQRLDFGRICQAVAKGPSTLEISFTLVNVSSTEVTLIDVQPVARVGGLRPLGPKLAGGTCEDPGREPLGGLLGPGDTQLITMRFQMPKTCPQPPPGPAQVGVRATMMVGTTTVPVFANLGSVTFESCPDPA